jgi:hypothetical protein
VSVDYVARDFAQVDSLMRALNPGGVAGYAGAWAVNEAPANPPQPNADASTPTVYVCWRIEYHSADGMFEGDDPHRTGEVVVAIYQQSGTGTAATIATYGALCDAAKADPNAPLTLMHDSVRIVSAGMRDPWAVNVARMPFAA